MTKKEIASGNIGMTFDFIRQLVEHPDIADAIENDAELDFIDKDVPFKEKERVKGKKVAKYLVEHVFAPIKS